MRAPEYLPEADDKHLRAFGSELKGIDFGNKYITKVDDNPTFNQYSPEKAEKLIKPRIPIAQITQPYFADELRTIYESTQKI